MPDGIFAASATQIALPPSAAYPALPIWGVSHPSAGSSGPDRPTPGADGATPRPLAGRRILLAEDEMMVALDLELALQDEGADVLGPAGDLQEGMRLLRGEAQIDAAILDVDLHGEDVFPVAEALQARGVPFLFHTGHGAREELQRRFGGVPVWTKPMLAEDLIDAVAGLLT